MIEQANFTYSPLGKALDKKKKKISMWLKNKEKVLKMQLKNKQSLYKI